MKNQQKQNILDEKQKKDPLLHMLSMNHDLVEDFSESEASKKWYNRQGVKRKLTALGIVLFLIASTMFLLRKEVKLEKTADTLRSGQTKNKRQIAAVISIELGLLTLNGFAAYRAVKITKAWRAARIGDIVSKTKATINVITHPPKVLRPIMAPFQLTMRRSRPIMRVLMKLKGKIEKRAEIAAREFEKRRTLFTNELSLQFT